MPKTNFLTNNSLENLRLAFSKSNPLTSRNNSNDVQSLSMFPFSVQNTSISSSLIGNQSTIQSFAQSMAQSFLPFAQQSLNALVPALKAKEQLMANIFKNNLKPNELIAVRQLISGYRESAAYLLRSAQELEGLLQEPLKS